MSAAKRPAPPAYSTGAPCGATATAPGYGYEECNAQHDHTEFPEDSEFYMTFLGPLNFIDDDGNTIALVGCKQVLEAWDASQG